MLYIIALFLLVFQAALLFRTPFNAFPEHYLFPWLILLGKVPYRDFFDHHGLFIYYVLAPVIYDRSLLALQMVYVFIQLVSTVIFILILKRTSRWMEVGFAALLYVLSVYVLIGNTTWYDTWIAMFALLVFYLLFKKPSYGIDFAIGTAIAVAALVKPPSGLILIPSLIKRRSPLVVISFTLTIAGVLLYLFANGVLQQAIDQLVLFNLHYVRVVRSIGANGIPHIFIVVGMFALVWFIFSVIKYWTLISSLSWCAGLFALCLSLPLISSPTTVSLIPVVPFVLIAAFSLVRVHQPFVRTAFYICTLIFLILFFKEARFQYKQYVRGGRYVDNTTTQKIVSDLRALALPRGSFFIFANHPEVYYLLNSPPPIRFTFIFPWIDSYYNLTQQLSYDLEKHAVRYVYLPVGSDPVLSVSNLKRTISSYQVVKKGRGYVLYERKNK